MLAGLEQPVRRYGAVRGVGVMRWGDVGRTGFGYIPFGGDVHAERH